MTADIAYMKISWVQCVGAGLLFAFLSGACTAIVAFVWIFTSEVLS